MKPATAHALMTRVLVDDGCWEWAGHHNRDSYACVGHQGKAHRVVYEWVRGPIPAGMELDHLCRNRGCVRPDHLEPVTHAENMRRGVWAPTRKTHCIRGHEFTPENTYLSRGQRWCIECRRIRDRQRRRSA